MMAQWYLALPDPRVQALGLRQEQRKGKPSALITAPLYQLPSQEEGAPIIAFHDRIRDGLVDLIHLAGVANFTVEDNQILQPVANAQLIARLGQQTTRKDKEFCSNYRRHLVRPDLVLANRALYDVKTLNGAAWQYRERTPFYNVSAAERRQREVSNEYLAHIQALDDYTHPRDTRPDCDAKGPLQNKFENLGFDVKGLVFGLFGEVSPSVNEFINLLAHQGAPIHLQAAVTRSLPVSRAQLKAVMVRRLGMVVARGRAQQIISIMAKYPKAHHIFGTFAEVLHGVPSKALRCEVDGTLAHAMETLNTKPVPSFTGAPGALTSSR